MMDDALLDELRTEFAQAGIRRVLVPNAVDESAARALRESAAPGLQPFYVANRGRYHINRTFAAPGLFDALRVLGEGISTVPLAPGAACWLRFRRGDYQLLQGDAADTPERGRHLELTVDISAAATGQAEFVYVRDPDRFSFPQLPLALTIVERTENLFRYDEYLNNTVGEAEVWRLRLALRYA